jgi:hypothetical protein
MTAVMPTLVVDGFSAFIDWIAYEESSWLALMHGCSLFGQKTAVEAIRARLRMGETGMLHLPAERSARLVNADSFVTRTRRVGAVTHVTVLREPQSLTAKQSLLLLRDADDPAQRFHRVCDALVTTPLHPTWAGWLWQWAKEAGAVQRLHTTGCQAWTVTIDEPQLEQSLSQALRSGALTMPTPAAEAQSIQPVK